jgi:hydrogenase expression/formation protein HypC
LKRRRPDVCLALPGKITAIRGEGVALVAAVEIAGTEREVSLAMTPKAVVGDYVVTHSGVAIRLLGPEEARAADGLIIEALGQ